VSRYIHLNPVSAKICQYPEQYVWSSYPYYIKKTKNTYWLHSQYILNLISEKNSLDRELSALCNAHKLTESSLTI